MSLTKVRNSMIEGTYVTASDFGAVGNGVADDSVAIQNAVNEAISSGSNVVWLKTDSNYAISGITNTSAVTFLGKNITFTGQNIETVNLNDVIGKSDYSGSFFDPPTQVTTQTGAVGSIVPAGGWSSEDAIDGTYEVLRTLYPDYITRTLLGVDESGLYNIYKYVFEPEDGYEKTIILTSCTHGNEYTSFYSLFQIMESICYSWSSYSQYNFLRNKVRIVVIPHVNPWGFSEGRRQNFNGVDLNRQSSVNWARFTSSDLVSSTATSGGVSTLVDTSQAWGNDDYVKTKVEITGGTGSGQSYYISGNTADTITIDGSWVTPPDATSTYVIRSKYYKGTSAWSEVESQYYKAVCDEYPNATVALDLHTINTLSAHYIIYTPRFNNTLTKKIRQIIDSKFEIDERVVWNTTAYPTLTNYPGSVYGMLTGNPEFKNLLFGANYRDSDEMTRAFWWNFNIIYELTAYRGNALQLNSEEPYLQLLSLNGLDVKNHFFRVNGSDEVRGLRVNYDGDFAYVLNQDNQTIYEFALDRTGDIDSASATGNTLDVSAQTGTFAQDFFISKDTDKIFAISSSNNKIYQYDMTVKKLDTASYASKSFDLSSEFLGGDDVATTGDIDYDGTKVLVAGTGSIIRQYVLSTGNDLSTMTYDSDSLDVNVTESDLRGLGVDKASGGINHAYIVGEENNKVYRYDMLAQDGDISDATKADMEIDLAENGSDARVVDVSPTGDKLYTLYSPQNLCLQWDLDTNHDLDTANNLDNEYIYLSSDNSQKSIWCGRHEFDTKTAMIIHAIGEITLRADRDCVVEINPFLYQPVAPEFGWGDVKNTINNYYKVRRKLNANEDTPITFTSLIHAQPINTGMDYDEIYGDVRTREVKFRPRINSVHSSVARVMVKGYRVSITTSPTDLGAAIKIYDASGNMRYGQTQFESEGQAPQIVYPNSNIFNVKNYEDGDDYTMPVTDPADDDAEGTE